MKEVMINLSKEQNPILPWVQTLIINLIKCNNPPINSHLIKLIHFSRLNSKTIKSEEGSIQITEYMQLNNLLRAILYTLINAPIYGKR